MSCELSDRLPTSSSAHVNPTTSTWCMSTTTMAISPRSSPTLSARPVAAHAPIWWIRILPTMGSRVLTKVRHSTFYSTPLAYLLNRLGTKRLILTGQVTEQCILYTALDAYVRHIPVVIPTDAVAHIDAELSDAALTMMKQNMSAELTSAADCLG